MPWSHLSTAEVRTMILSTFEFPARGLCTSGAYRIIKSCLRLDPKERPSFDEIKLELSAVYVPINGVCNYKGFQRQPL